MGKAFATSHISQVTDKSVINSFEELLLPVNPPTSVRHDQPYSMG